MLTQMDERRRTNLLLEALETRFQTIMEYLQDVPDKARIRKLEKRVGEIERELALMRLGMQHQSETLSTHDKRLTELE